MPIYKDKKNGTCTAFQLAFRKIMEQRRDVFQFFTQRFYPIISKNT